MNRQPTIAPVATLAIRAALLAAPFLLSLAGLTLCVIGVWAFDWRLGLVAAGVACFVLEWRVMPGDATVVDVQPVGTPGPFTPSGP